jgi:hypothetical protein
VVVMETEAAVVARGRAARAAFVLRPGTEVAVDRPARGAVRADLTGRVQAQVRLAGAALGVRVARDLDLDGAMLYEGALVRVIGRGSKKGTSRVQTVGAVTAELEVPEDALTVAPRTFVYRMPPPSRVRDGKHRFVTPHKDTTLYLKAESVGTNAPPVGVVKGGVEVVLIDQQGAMALVRSDGPVAIEGWALNREFADRGAGVPEAQLLKPTHEVSYGASLYAEAGGTVPIARLRGGTLVEWNGQVEARAKVTTVGPVVASGYVDVRELRALKSVD